MTVKSIEKLNSSYVQDELLVSAVSGQTTKINAITLVAENDTDLTHKSKWFITDGQRYDIGSLTNDASGNVADGEIVTITDNAGNTVIFEYEVSGGVSGTNTSVAVGDDIGETLQNLATAVASAITNKQLFLSSSYADSTGGEGPYTGGEAVLTLTERVATGSNSLTTDATNAPATDFTGGGASVLAQGFCWNHTPIVTANNLSTVAAGSTNTAVNLSIEVPDGHYGFNLMGCIYYTTT